MAKKNITRKVKSNVNNNVYKAIDFSYLLGKVKGIDDKLMQIHFKLYEGFVAATNGALQFFNSKNASNMIQYSGVQREFSYFYNAMRLHELYFGVMCGEYMDKMDPKLVTDINKYFGSFDAWKKNFIYTGTIPGDGFAVLCRDRNSGILFNTWINDFNIGQIIGVDYLLVMDMWEHAYITEFGIDLEKYAQTFLNNVNWSVVSKVYNESVSNTSNLIFDNKTA